jgi:hypothetical protein
MLVDFLKISLPFKFQISDFGVYSSHMLEMEIFDKKFHLCFQMEPTYITSLWELFSFSGVYLDEHRINLAICTIKKNNLSWQLTAAFLYYVSFFLIWWRLFDFLINSLMTGDLTIKSWIVAFETKGDCVVPNEFH